MKLSLETILQTEHSLRGLNFAFDSFLPKYDFCQFFLETPTFMRKALRIKTNPPATGLILLLQALQDLVVNYVWFKTNCADSCQVPETLQKTLLH